MGRFARAGSLVLLTLATSFAHATFEDEWIALRNQKSADGYYPAGYGLRPEDLMAAHPKPTPAFWNDHWTELTHRWATEAYVTVRLAREGAVAAAENEVRYLRRTLLDLNVRAQAACRRQSDECQRTIRIMLLEGLRYALDLAGVLSPPARARVAAAFAPLADETATEASLRALTKDIALEWRRHDAGARGLRTWQTAPVMVLGTAGAVVTAREHGLNIFVLAWGALTMTSPLTADAFLKDWLPFTTRFRWRENLVANAVAECALELGAAPGTDE